MTRLRFLSALLFASAPILASEAQPTSWQAVGWGGGAFYYAVSWHPTDGNVIYLGGDCAGLYRTENKAKQWEFANNGITDYAVYSTATSSAAPDLVYALTDGGLHKSVDRAQSWTFIADSAKGKLGILSKRGGSVRAIGIDPANADIVYVGAHDGKLWKTADGAATWTELPYRDAFPKPQQPAFTGTASVRVTYDAGATGNDPMGRISKLFGPGDKAQDWSAYQRMTARFLVPADAPAVQAQLVVQSGEGWTWQQGDWIEGKPGTWVEVPLDLASLSDLDSVRMIHIAVRTFQPGWKGTVHLDSVALHTDPAGTLAAGAAADGTKTVVVADWEQDGEGWTANSQGQDYRKITALGHGVENMSGDVLSSVAVAGDGAVYITNTKLGVLRSDDAGATWKPLDAPKSAMAISTTADPNVLWLAADNAGALRSDDRGETWAKIALAENQNPKLAVREIVSAPSRAQRLYAIATIGWGGYLYASDDGGATWTTSTQVKNDVTGNPTLPDDVGNSEWPKGTSPLSSIKNIAVNPLNHDEFFIAGNWRNIFSGDGGKTLEERSTGADNTCATDIQFHDGKVYATAMDEGLLVTEDGGKQWRQLIPLKYEPNTSGHFWRVRVATIGDQKRIITTASPWNSYGDSKFFNRAYVSMDGGATFALSHEGLPNYVPNVNCMWGRSHARAMAQHPTDPNIVYVGMDGDPEPAKNLPGGGIFRSADAGRTWTRCATQPGGLRMYYGLAIDPSDPKRLWYSACGKGGGAWTSPDEGATWQHVFKQEDWTFNIDVSPTGVVYVGGKNLWRSADRGQTWTKQTDFNDDPTIVGIAIDPDDEQRLWISRLTWGSNARGGIYRTLDGGETWHEITGDIPIRRPQILRYDASKRELWAAGVGIFKTAQ